MDSAKINKIEDGYKDDHADICKDVPNALRHILETGMHNQGLQMFDGNPSLQSRVNYLEVYVNSKPLAYILYLNQININSAYLNPPVQEIKTSNSILFIVTSSEIKAIPYDH